MMNIAIGRRKLVIHMIEEQAAAIADRMPAADAGTARELSAIEARRQARFDRDRWQSSAVLYGVGHPR